jgi:peptide/nickel transport system substrate-binding protein
MELNRRDMLLLSTSSLLLAATRLSAQATPDVLRFAPHAALRVLDPVTTRAYITRNHGFLVYDQLFGLDSGYVPQPQMVDTWEVSEDGLNWSFTLRDGLAFHDGAPVTAEDVVASINRWWQQDVIGLRLKAVTTEMTATDDKSFALTLSEPFGAMLEALARPTSHPLFVMPKRVADLPPSEMLTEVVGSGPFKFLADEFRPGASWAYARNEDYVPREEAPDSLAGAKVPGVARIEVTWFPSPETAISAIINDELDMIESVSPDRRKLLEGTDIQTMKKVDPSAATIRFNWAQPPFDDEKLRKAVQMVASQTDYMDLAIGSPEAYKVCGAFFGCDTRLETDAGFTEGSLDNVEAAKQLVAESSYDGQKIVIITPGDVASFAPLAPMTQQVLAAIGIDSEIQTMEWSAFLERRARTVPVTEGGWNLAHAVFSSIDLSSPLGNANFDARGLDGYTGFIDDPETEELKTAYQREADPAKQVEIAEQIQIRGHEHVFYIPLGIYYDYVALRPDFTGYVGSPIINLWGLEAT